MSGQAATAMTNDVDALYEEKTDLQNETARLKSELANAKERIAALATENEEIRSFAQEQVRLAQDDYERKMKSWGITCALQTFGLCKDYVTAPTFDEVAALATKYQQYACAPKDTVQ